MTSKASKVLLFGGTSFLVLLFLLKHITFSVLTFETNEQLLWSREDGFSLQWIHSVEKEEWIENYKKIEQDLLLTTTRFKTFGAGVPSTPNDTSQTKIEDGFVVMDIHRHFPSLELVVSQNVQSTLLVGEKTFSLYEWAGNYETVKISIQSLSLWDMYLKGERL